MATTQVPVPAPAEAPSEQSRAGLLEYLTTVDHKKIGILYLYTAFGVFFAGGILALLVRAELAEPGLQYMGQNTYNQVFTMHGTLIVLSSFLVAGGSAAAGWTAYPPLSDARYLQGTGMDLWIIGLLVVGLSGILGSINLLTTIFRLRAPGMTMFRVPMFVWTVLINQLLILLAFPALTAALAMLFLDRQFGAGFFNPDQGGTPVLYLHIFWFFGHPEVYIIILPVFGIISEVTPVFSRKPLFGYRAMVFATFLIAGYSFTVWPHHMFTTGQINLYWFSIMSFIIAVPTGIKVFNWLATMWRGSISLTTAMLMVVGFLVVFVIGGITGVFLASAPIDFAVNDTYYVVAHFHYVMVGALLFGLFAGLYYWFPKMSGRLLSEAWGRLHFWSF